MELRHATDDDREMIETLVFSILRSYGLEPSPESTDADLAAIEETYFRQNGFFDLLESKTGEILGTVAIHRTTPDLCELRKMYLSPDLRGHGWGKRLLEHALDGARDLGYRTVWLETADSLKEAHALYQSYGFQDFEGPHCSERCDFAMSLDL